MKTMIKTIISITIAFAILFSGCVEKDDKQFNITDGQVTSTPISQDTQIPQYLENSKNVVDLIKKDATTRFGLSENDIQVDSIIPVEWTDTSLGYPEPGKEPGKDYSIETIKGYTILIYAKGKLYEYHSDYYRIVPPEGPAPTVRDMEDMPRIISESDDSSRRIIDFIKKDLISRYRILEEDMKVIDMTPTKWPDKSLGVPRPGEGYPQEETPGFVILVSDGNNIYEYHSNSENATLYRIYKI